MVTLEVIPIVEAVFDILILVESVDNVFESCDVDNVSKLSDVIIDPPQTGDE